MIKTLIIYPEGEDDLESIAFELKVALQRVFKFKKAETRVLEEINSTNCFLEQDVILVGTPTIKKDISWPVQVKIDGMLHNEKCSLSTKIVSAFTFSDDSKEAQRCLDAILWAFNETDARIADGLVILENYSDGEKASKFKEFVDMLKTIKI